MIENISSLKQVTSCGAIVYQLGTDITDTQILLIKQNEASPWGIPKGKMNPGESHEECAIREVFEETGVVVSLGKKLQSVCLLTKRQIKTVIAFYAKQVCKAKPNHKNPASEVCAAKWFRMDSLPTIQDYQAPLIAEATEYFARELKLGAKINPEEEIKKALTGVLKYAYEESDWVVIKKEILRALPSQIRTFFSTRDPKTKDQSMNEFEIEMAKLWSQLTQRPVVFKNEKISAS